MRGATLEDAGEILATTILAMMRVTDAPNGVAGVGFVAADVPALARSAAAQRRLLDNAPLPVDEATLAALFAGATQYW